jgi:hypothetical protein
VICRYCRTPVSQNKDAKGGKFVRIKLKAFKNIYSGDIYITKSHGRVSNVVNDVRKFMPIVTLLEKQNLMK